MKTFKAKYRVQWVDTDSARVMHFSNYFRYFEFAETDLYRILGFDFETSREKYGIWLPRIEAHCRYLHPCRFNEEIEVEIWIDNLGEKHIKYGFKVYNLNQNELAAEGWVVVVAASVREKKAVPIPTEIREKIKHFFELQ